MAGEGRKRLCGELSRGVISPGPCEERHQHDAVRRMSDDPRYRRDAWGRQRRQAQQTAYEALHQGCNTLQWTGSGFGFVGSTAVFFTARVTCRRR